MKIYEGSIITVDAHDSVARYLVEDRGRILYVGDRLPWDYAAAPRISLGDRALLPAFVDTHQHLASFATFRAGLNVMDANDNGEIMEMIRSFVSQTGGRTLIAFGASPFSVREGRLINREELDAVCPEKEIMVVKYDGHACIVNTPLLRKLEEKVKDLRGYHPDTGEMNQEAFFAFSDYITNSISLVELFGNLQDAVDYEASQGIGCLHTVSGVGFPGNLDITLEQTFARSLDNGFQVRVFPQSMKIRTATRRGLPRIGGCFQCALDGCFGSADAAMNEPYATGGDGVLFYEDEEVIRFCREANRAGLQIEMHAIGDRAFDQACRALKAALDDYPRKDHRHGIIHACLPTREGLDICEKYHIQLPVQSAFIDWKQEPDSYVTSLLGEERASRLNPLRTFWDRGIVISGGSDAPCTTPAPLDWIHRAVNRSDRSQALTVQEALRMCTYNGYWTCFDEKERGSLEAGKIADMVILSENPYTADPEYIRDIRVEQLLLRGEPYRSARRPVALSALRGLLRH